MTVLCVCYSCTALCSDSERWHDVNINFLEALFQALITNTLTRKIGSFHLFISSLCSMVILFTITDQIQRIHILSYTESHAEVIKEYYLSTFYLMRRLHRKGFPAVLKSKVPQNRKTFLCSCKRSCPAPCTSIILLLYYAYIDIWDFFYCFNF